MQLKRKRSESGLSTSTSSTFNSPLRFTSCSAQSTDVSMGADSFNFTTNFSVSPLPRFGTKTLQFPRVPGRTMKRFRDDRPSEDEVHQRTLNILYSAQRQQTPAQPREINVAHQPQDYVPVAAQPGTSSSSSSSSHQANLHSFWNLPSQPSALPAVCLPATSIEIPTECEDCGQKLGGGDDDMMDVDGTLDMEDTSCGACGKHVCSYCSVTNLGEQRRCLGCAGRTMGAGNIAKTTIPWGTGISSWLC